MIKNMNKYPKMIHYPLWCEPWFGRVYFEELFNNCLQLQPNSDGTWDIYDIRTEKHLMRVS